MVDDVPGLLVRTNTNVHEGEEHTRYTCVKPMESQVESDQHPQQPRLPTPIVVAQLKQYLARAPTDLREYVITGFSQGFKLGYSGTPNNNIVRNATSVRDNMVITRQLVQKEIDKGRFAGPYSSPPFDSFQTSPLSIKPKKCPGEYRLVLDLSAPYDDTSVNKNIDKKWASVHYASIMDAVDILLRLGRGSFMAKTDIESAFRLVPIHPDDYHLLCFTLDGLFYFDKSLPMGCSSSCRVFETIAVAIEWIAKNHFGLLNTIHYL